MLISKQIPIYYVLNKVKFELLYVLLIALAVHYLSYILKSFLPQIPLTIPAFIGTVISILLSFKLNQSYDRWWEARKIWGSIVNDSRTLVLQLQTFVSKGNDKTIKKMGHRQIAWCYSLGQSLREKSPIENLEKFISSSEIEAIQLHNNKPLALLQLHSADLAELKENNQLDTYSQIQIDQTLLRLCGAMGGAERIKSTIFPITHLLFLQLIIYLFVVTLSIALREIEIYYEIPLLLLISNAFFVLEKTAIHLQDPFNDSPTDTAMTTLAQTIEINIKQLLKENDVPEPVQVETFYLL
jgi:ion channel-forming bestrophin family protein